MTFEILNAKIMAGYSRLSAQLQRGARHVLDHPDDVALMSMRALAVAADVHPSTMMRLARSFGFTSYNDFRKPYQERLRARPAGYLARARTLQARGDSVTREILEQALERSCANLRETLEKNGPEKFEAFADALSGARQIYVVGLRSCFPVAFFFHYVARLFSDRVDLLDGRGGTFADNMRTFGKGDVLFAAGFNPYTAETVRAAAFAKARRGHVLVMTDSAVSPLAQYADHSLIVRTQTPAFFDSVAAALVMVEVIAQMLVARGGPEMLRAIAESEAQLASFDAYWHDKTAPSKAKPPARRLAGGGGATGKAAK